MTARGGIVGVFAGTALGSLLDAASGLGWITGICFVIGCLLAVVSVRPPDLLGFTVSPPLSYLLVLIIGQVIGGWGGTGQGGGMFLRLITDLIGATPWLFLGTVLVVGIAMLRGLPANVHDLNQRLLAERADRPDDTPVPAKPGKQSRGGTRRAPSRAVRAVSSPFQRYRRADAADDPDPVRWDEDPPL